MTPAPRQLAEQMDRDRAALEGIGVRAAARVGRRARLAAQRAYAAGGDPVAALDAELEALAAAG